MKVKSIELNSDNYGYLLIDDKSKECAIVDVSSQPQIMMDNIEKEGLTLKMVLTTHKHWDHAGGNNEIKNKFPHVPIYGGSIDQVEGCTNVINDKDIINFGSITIQCLHTPGHTMGHICYYCTCDDLKIVFTGDTLFLGGAGKFFEGTGSDMHFSLYEQLAKLLPETLMYCGHEYTLSNYKFALSLEPENPDLLAEVERAKALRDENKPTIPSTIGRELKINPFMRVNEPSIKKLFPSLSEPHEILAAVRSKKDKF